MRGSFARMKDIRAYVDGLPSLLAECMDIVRCHLSLSKVPTAPLDPLGPFHSEDDIPPAIKLAILSLQILTSGEFPQMTPPNRHVQDVVSRSSNGILAWTEWICCNFILPEPQSIFMLKYRSRIHSIMFHTLRTFYRVGLRPQVTARPTLVATFWKIWKAEPSIQHDRDQLNRIAPDSHSLAELFLSQDQSFSYIIGNVGLRTADPTEAGTGTIVRFNHFDYAEVREVLHDTHWVVNHAVQNLKSTAYSNSPQYMSLHSHLAILGIFLDHPPLLELMQTNKTVVIVLNICSHLLRPSLPEANVWMAREAILQASEFLLGMLETGVVASIDALEAGLLVMFFKSERVHWYNGAELGPPGVFQEPVAVITLYEKCLQAVIPLMTVRSAMRLAQKSVKHIHAHNLEQPLLSRPKSTLQQFPSVWETLIDHLAVFNAWYSQFVVEGELYTNKCAYKVCSCPKFMGCIVLTHYYISGAQYLVEERASKKQRSSLFWLRDPVLLLCCLPESSLEIAQEGLSMACGQIPKYAYEPLASDAP